jgi:hypothetical protein
VWLLLPMPAETVPLWVQLFVAHALLDGLLGTCVTTWQVLVGGLTHLGFTCETMAAAVLVSPAGPGAAPGDGSVGVIGAPPIVREGGTTNGHIHGRVGRLHGQAGGPDRRPRAPPGRSGTVGSAAGISVCAVRQGPRHAADHPTRGAYQLVWHLYPEWTDILDGVLTDPIREGIPYGSLNLAHKTMDILRHLGEHRDPAPMLAAHPHLHDLLSSIDPHTSPTDGVEASQVTATQPSELRSS